MKILMVSGSHPRHAYVMKKIADLGYLGGIVYEKREPMMLDMPNDLPNDLREMYRHHFELRQAMEDKYFGEVDIDDLLGSFPHLEIEEEQLNDAETLDFAEKTGSDFMISYGPGLLSNEFLDLFPEKAFNLHGGLSPWYKGSATMFWPFYFLEPNYVGTTFHHTAKRIDGGNIVHQSVPELAHGDCMHEVACKAVVQATDDLGKIAKLMENGANLEGVAQKKNGKLFLNSDWRPEHLRLIYETYDDKIVDCYLNGDINKNNEPNLVKAF